MRRDPIRKLCLIGIRANPGELNQFVCVFVLYQLEERTKEVGNGDNNPINVVPWRGLCKKKRYEVLRYGALQDTDAMATGKERPERIELLDRVPVEGMEHFGRPFKEHLIGTHDLLDQWENSPGVCLAGLFHSIYGTKTFELAALSTDSRDDVRSLIGEQAEALVFAFGMSDRKRLLLENQSPPYRWIDHRTGEQTEIDEEFLNGLVEMEVANFIEQMPFRTDKADSVIRDMRHRFESNLSRMSAGARDEYNRVFDELFGRVPVSAKLGG